MRVFNVGGLGVDKIKKTKLLSKSNIEKQTGIKFSRKNFLITFHPVTMGTKSSKTQFKEILNALNKLEDINLIFTMPNADSDGRVIINMINDFVSENPKRATAFKSMGQLNYLSTMQFVDGLIGNSSSGLLEAPTFKIATINIGDRQKGRLKSSSVLDCEPNQKSIEEKVNFIFTEKFKKILVKSSNPYGEGNATNLIFNIIKKSPLPAINKKPFYNL